MNHVIGLGSIGKLVSHTLRQQQLPVTLLLRPNDLNRKIASNGGRYSISVEANFEGQVNATSQNGFGIELIGDDLHDSSIETLFVCTKAYDTTAALSSLSGRLDSSSNVVLMNNGVGVLDEIHTTFKGAFRPALFEAILSHGAYTSVSNASQTTVIHAGRGDFYVAPAHQHPDSARATFLHKVCAKLSLLQATETCIEDFKRLQYLKLLVNSVINPITAISGITNGETSRFQPLIARLVREWMVVIRELSIGVEVTFDEAYELVLSVIEKTATNKSSMLQDVMAGRRTEIDYINGYLIRKGKALGCDVRYNEALYELVRRAEGR